MASLSVVRPYVTHDLGRSKFEVDPRYVDLKPIGKGAYGLVASATDTITGRKVAIKRISRVFQDLVDAKRILREIKLLRHFGRHENVVEIFDLMTTPPENEDFHTLYIVTSLFECDLDRIVMSSQRLTDQHAQYFTYQTLRGLKYIHSASVIHRDLKPSNLLVKSNCDLAICDFGLARGMSGETDFRMTEYVVTRWYRAPELLCDMPTYGTAVDIWSVGCILAEILGRRPLFRGANTKEQLELIVTKLGVDEDDLAVMPIPKQALEHIRRVAPAPEAVQAWSAVLPMASAPALDLLSKMLVFNPSKRITLPEALLHPYLQSLRNLAQEPVCRNQFDFAFEAGWQEEIPQHQLQKLMFEELVLMRRSEQRAPASGPAAAWAGAAGAGAAGAPAAAGGMNDG